MCGDREDTDTCVSTGCHFQHSNKYRFEIKVEMPLNKDRSKTLPVSLMAANQFKSLVLQVRTGMDLQFNATFVDGMGSDKLTLYLTSLVLDQELYEEHEEEDEEEAKQYLLTRFLTSLKNTISLLLEIVLGYTASDFSV